MTLHKAALLCGISLPLALSQFAANSEEGRLPKRTPAVPVEPVPDYDKNFVFRLSTDKEKYVEGESVMLRISLANISKEDAAYGDSGGITTYNIKVTRLDGREVPLTLYGDRERKSINAGGSYQRSMLPAGYNKIVTIPLSRYFDLSMGGTYKVSASVVLSTYTTGAQRANLTTSIDLKLPE